MSKNDFKHIAVLLLMSGILGVMKYFEVFLISWWVVFSPILAYLVLIIICVLMLVLLYVASLIKRKYVAHKKAKKLKERLSH
jgi:uncharacterized membrane protein